MPMFPFATTTTLPPVEEAVPPELAATLCPGDRPLLLLPVRLETRFFGEPGGGAELRVRIYPDTIHLDSHERDVTATEAEWGRHFWTRAWLAGAGTRSEQDAWRQLADRFGARRAGYLATVLRPVNPQDRPASPAGHLVHPPRFADLTAVADEEGTWRHPPVARLLPPRWTAIVRAGGQVVAVATGRAVQAPLAVGPDPTRPVAPAPDDEIGLDDGMAWMVDFDAAEAAGMGLRIPLPAAVVDQGVEGLYVLGAGTGPPADGAAAMADLLDAHHYTDGLRFLRLGTPSNNLGPRRAGGGPDDLGHRASWAAELSDPSALPPDSNAARLGAVLGLPAARALGALGRLDGAADSHERDQRSVGTALWEAGWGYFLSNQIGYRGTGLTPQAASWARAHFTGAVRGGGPMPALRCGRQPYGVLPVTSLDRWQPAPGHGLDGPAQAWLRDLLVRLRDRAWRPQLGQAARVGRRQPPDPDADLAEVMRSDGASAGYRTRALLGRHYLEHLRAFHGENLRAIGFFAAEDALLAEPTALLGLAGPPRVGQGTFADTAWPILVPMVLDGAPDAGATPGPGEELSDAEFIAGLLAGPTIAGVAATAPGSLLQALLRHAMLREYAVAAAAIVAGGPPTDQLRDAELIDLVEGAPPASTWQRQLDQTVPAVTGTATVRQYLQSRQSFDTPALASLGAFRESLAHLATLDGDALRTLAATALDLSTDRLDAWITSLATRRLAELRASAPEGLYVGGYGWVENLAPQPTPEPVTPPDGEPGPLFAAQGDTGFVHAPSATHAATAALLRNAHLGADGTPTADSPFSVTLSSRAVRDADRLLDGVRQGQPLGALLGYRFERALREAELDVFVAPVRALAPLVAGRLTPTNGPAESVAPANVVDGLALHRLWQDTPEAVRTRLQEAGANPDQVDLAGEQLDDLAAAVDALGDALVAETAYQAVRGNITRTAATLSSIAHGEAPPPELEVARIPRPGTAMTHRLLTLLPAETVPPPGWTPGAPRSAAEPVLDRWAGLLLGDPRQVRCTVELVDGAGGVVATRTFPLAEIGLAALDAVYAAETADLGRRSASELEDLVVDHAAAGAPAGTTPRPRHDRPTDLGPGELTLLDVLEQARSARALFAGARAADADDLAPPERAFAGGVDLTELEHRVATAEHALAAAHTALDQLAGPDGQPSPAGQQLRAALLALGRFGVPGTTPPPGAGPTALLARAAAVLRMSRSRLDDGAAAAAQPVATDPYARRNQLVNRMRLVFGGSFLVLPRFGCAPEQAQELAAARAAGTGQGADPVVTAAWLTRLERVRPPVARLAQVLSGAEVLGTGDAVSLSVAQLPLVPSERWVGLPTTPDRPLPPGKLSLALHVPVPVDVAAPLAAVFVDEWVEVVPSAEQDTAVTFQFDPPGAFAPQTLLLAVPPVRGKPWTAGTLHRVLLETLDLAKLRGVRSDALEAVGQYLPSLFLAFNARDDAVSTDFGPLIGREE